MNEHELLDAVGGIDERYVNKAAAADGAAKRTAPSARRWGTLAAACLCIVIAGAVAIPKWLDRAPAGETDQQPGNETSVEKEQDGEPASVPAQPDSTEPAAGLFIPGIELPETGGAELDMLALVVYKGRIYLQADVYSEEEAEQFWPLVGEHLGTATGTIDEWSSQDDYAEEFASSCSGEVYTVKGYDEDFRICCISEWEDEEGNTISWINVLDCLNGITVEKGRDVFEDRLHLTERLEAVKWQAHNDWDYALGNMQDAAFAPGDWETFMEALDNGEFQYMWDPNASPTIYDTDHQAHLFLQMDDGTRVRLRLIEGGYVGLDGMHWYFVQLPEEDFEPVFTACGGTH